MGAVAVAAALAMTTAAACRTPGWPPHGGPDGGGVRTVTFDTAGAHTWTVPAGVRFATFDLVGAEGGGGEPGQGAHVRATIHVEPGQTLTLVVGGEGGDPVGQTAGAGGVGGGAAGGTGGDPFALPPEYGIPPFPGGVGAGGGGGASDVRTGAGDGTGLATRLVVAGGGGGAAGVAGGDGGLEGLPGDDGSVTYNIPDFPPAIVAGGMPGGGSDGLGLPGADGPDARLDTAAGRPGASYSGNAGGGGGGGLVGGGGGQSASSGQSGIVQWSGVASGGAGGSSLVPADGPCPTVVEDGVRAGDGRITVTFRRGAAPARACL